jgi:hypothetical protein
VPVRLALVLPVLLLALALPSGVQAAGLAQLPVPQRMLSVARGELAAGVGEQPRGSNQGARIAAYRRAAAGSAPGTPWCAYFASWVARQAGSPLGPGGHGLVSSGAILSWARGRHLVHASARPGDLIVMAEHVGVVVGVSPGAVSSIDGIWSDRVSRTSHPRSQALGFVRLSAPEPLLGVWEPTPAPVGGL